MPRFAFDELIRAEDDEGTPDLLVDEGVSVMSEAPKLGSLFPTPHSQGTLALLQNAQYHNQLLQQHPASLPTGRASLGAAAAASPVTPSMHRPISRRIQSSAPRPATAPFSAKPLLPSSPFSSALTFAVAAPSPPPSSFRSGGSHRAPQPVAPSYPPSPLVPLDSAKAWRQDAGLFLGRSFRATFGPNGELYMPSPVRGAAEGGHRVRVVALPGSVFKPRPYGELMQATPNPSTSQSLNRPPKP